MPSNMASANKVNSLDNLEDFLQKLHISVKEVDLVKGPTEGIYKNDSGPPRGAAFIANYREFSNNIKTRKGSEIDVENLTDLFSKMGNKVVKIVHDPCRLETIAEMQAFSESEILKNVDSMVLVVMSHGTNNNTFLTKNGLSMTSQEVCEMFNDKNCPNLKGKFKIFMFVHCRGNIARTYYQKQATREAGADLFNEPSLRQVNESERQKKDKSSSDMILLYSTCSGEVSLRTTNGTPYVHQVCRDFMSNSWKLEINDLMVEVQKGLHEFQGCEQREIRKKKKFYFNPKEHNKPKNTTEWTPQNQLGLDCDFIPPNQLGLDCDFIAPKFVSYVERTPSTKKHILLINNLDGCISDMAKLKVLFKCLGYNVVGPYSNVTYMKLKDIVKEFRTQEHNEDVFIVFYGDGFGDYIVTSDHCAIHFKDLQSALNDTNCPNLRNIPKIFITNLCYYEGDIQNECEGQDQLNMERQFKIDSSSQDLMLENCIKQVPADCDMFILNTEMEGSHCENGSLLTEALCKVLRENKSPKQLIKIMRLVSNTLDELQEGKEEDYICELRSIKFPPDFCIKPIEYIDQIKKCHVIDDNHISNEALQV